MSTDLELFIMIIPLLLVQNNKTFYWYKTKYYNKKNTFKFKIMSEFTHLRG